MLRSGKGNSAPGKGEAGLHKRAKSFFLNYSEEGEFWLSGCTESTERADFVMREVHLSLRMLRSSGTLTVRKVGTIPSVQLYTQECVALLGASVVPEAPPCGVNRFPPAHMIYSSSLLKAPVLGGAGREKGLPVAGGRVVDYLVPLVSSLLPRKGLK